MNCRHAVLHVIEQVIGSGRNLPDALAGITHSVNSKDQSLLQAMSYGVLRHYTTLEFIARQLLNKPLKKRDHDILHLILIGLYQLRSMRIPDHAAVSETVSVVKALKKEWARGVVNAVLRNYQRRREPLEQQLQDNEVARYAHPAWWIDKLKQDWPDQWSAILEANNQSPPMTLRINPLKSDRQVYYERLQNNGIQATPNPHATSALQLEQAVDVTLLPGFAEGEVSVQDAAAQLAAPLLDPHPDERILDACAAPGGKSAHLLELQPRLQQLLALDSDAQRLQRIDENLSRLNLTATLLHGRAEQPNDWWDGRAFDRILLDAPCSASGVIRRHPDIKHLRHADDIDPLTRLQHDILTALWPLLKSGGMLLYATCSVFAEENQQQIRTFLEQQATACLQTLDADWGHDTGYGQQILPGEDGMDGFFYALLQKCD